MHTQIGWLLALLGGLCVVVGVAARGRIRVRSGRMVTRKDEPLRFWFEVMCWIALVAIMWAKVFDSLMPYVVQALGAGIWRAG